MEARKSSSASSKAQLCSSLDRMQAMSGFNFGARHSLPLLHLATQQNPQQPLGTSLLRPATKPLGSAANELHLHIDWMAGPCWAIEMSLESLVAMVMLKQVIATVSVAQEHAYVHRIPEATWRSKALKNPRKIASLL